MLTFVHKKRSIQKLNTLIYTKIELSFKKLPVA